MSQTSIEWTDQTWNPIRGCYPVSPGCKKCYAERMAARNLPAMRSPTTGNPFAIMTDKGPKWTGKVELIESKLLEPLQWRKPRRVFVNSMSDLFHENLPDESIDRVFAVMALTPHITYQVLTKRAERMREWADKNFPQDQLDAVIVNMGIEHRKEFQWPLSNVWLGVSVEHQTTANQRIPELLRTPAALRFVSYEPALAEVDFALYVSRHLPQEIGTEFQGLPNRISTEPRLDWAIIGGESGPGARPFDIGWARNTIRQFKAAGVPIFCKQLGSAPHSDLDRISHRGDSWPRQDGFWKFLNDRKGGNWDEWPADLRVRQFPNVASHFAKGTA